VFVDINYDTINIDTDKIEQAITEKTKAIIAVHLHGLAVNMDKINRIAKKYNLKVIEDSCQAVGAKFKDKKTGTMGDCAAFSFNQNKCLCSGEGGMFVTDNEGMYNKAKTLWSFGENRSPVEKRDYHVYALGWMYRNNDLTAAFARAQLTKLNRYLEIQKENVEIFIDIVKDVKGLILPAVPEGYLHNWYNFTSRIDAGQFKYKGPANKLRDAIMAAIQAEGVRVGIWQSYILPAMTVFQARNAYGKGCPWKCPHARDVSYDIADFPAAQKHCDTHFGMTESLRAPNGSETAEYVGKAFKKVFENAEQLDVEKITAKK
jgi:perosamine synthetase